MKDTKQTKAAEGDKKKQTPNKIKKHKNKNSSM